MSWEDLNKDNIIWIKQFYYDYLDSKKDENYKSNLLTFEEFMEEEITKCERCGDWTIKNHDGEDYGYGVRSYLCEDCYDKESDEDEPDFYDEWREYQDYYKEDN